MAEPVQGGAAGEFVEWAGLAAGGDVLVARIGVLRLQGADLLGRAA
ncbi:hypothetical protein OG215_40880 (plasmid) [Streptomyces globisporus]|nr:hypothetical protein OG215_40880 [Streptomyces globisporus]